MIHHQRIFLGVFDVQVEQEIWDLCFRTINDPVELGLTGGGGPWARWMQLAEVHLEKDEECKT